jgi:hypothetical protein
MRHVQTSRKVSARRTALLLTLAVGCGGGDDGGAHATPCERMRDHLVDLRLASVDEDREAHRDVMRRALGAEFIDSCQRSMSDVQVTCILDADDSAEAAACIPETK